MVVRNKSLYLVGSNLVFCVIESHHVIESQVLCENDESYLSTSESHVVVLLCETSASGVSLVSTAGSVGGSEFS